jgi:hypothetical protein
MITPITGSGAGSPAPPVIAPEGEAAPTTVPSIESAPPMIAPEYEVVTVTVSSGAFKTSGKCTPGSVVVGHHPVGDVDKTIETIRISAGTVRVKLTGKSMQKNTFKVILLKPVEEPAEGEVEPVIATDNAVRPPEVVPGMVLKPPEDTTETE